MDIQGFTVGRSGWLSEFHGTEESGNTWSEAYPSDYLPGLHDVQVHPRRRAHDPDEARERLVPSGEELEVVQRDVREKTCPNLRGVLACRPR